MENHKIQTFYTQIDELPEQNDIATVAAPSSEVVNAAKWLKTKCKASEQVFEELFDLGDKVAILAVSKGRKSFFALQMALSLATGKNFLYYHTTKQRKVLYIQLEINEHHMQKRLRSMSKSMGVKRLELELLEIFNGRGADFDYTRLSDLAEQHRPEIIIIDPIYKLISQDENKPESFKPIFNEFDKITKNTGASIVYIHHDSKGMHGDKNIRDRGAGSGIIARDYDACFTLTHHRDSEDVIVVETLLRNYEDKPAQTIAWCYDKFEKSSTPAVKLTKHNSNRLKPDKDYVGDVLALLGEPLKVKEFDKMLKEKLGISVKKVTSVKKYMLENEHIEKSDREKVSGGGQFICKPEQLEIVNNNIKDKQPPLTGIE